MRESGARDGDSRVSLARSVLSCAHYFQVHVSQAKDMFSGFMPYNSRYPLLLKYL